MKNVVVILVVLAGCSRTPVSPITPVLGDPEPSILFFGQIETRNDDGGYMQVDSFYERACAKPDKSSALDRRVNGHALTIGVTSVKRDSAEIRVGYRDESREVSISRTATDLLFDADSVKVSITLGAMSLAPFASDDQVLILPVTAHKIDNGISPVPIRKHKVLATRKMNLEQAGRLRKLLTDNRYFALDGAMCFEPGMEFVFGEGKDAIHIVVCLECYKIHIATEDEKKVSFYYGLSKPGVAEFTDLFNEVF